MDIIQITEKLNLRCQEKLPGKRAQQQLLARPRQPIPLSNTGEHAIPAAILILLHNDVNNDNSIRFFLTERTHEVQYHKGQVAFPGGTWEEGEKLSETALRETHEEIGIKPEKVRIIGRLTPLFVSVTGFMIHPFIAALRSRSEPEPQPDEVKKVFSVHLEELLDPDSLKEEVRIIRDYTVDVPYFDLNGHKVWGATAMILAEFKACLEDIL
jgi:8-oxo-dGTP pyrophosphatase MutT (NUDIX family)